MEKLVHFVSLGCPKNLVDSEIMLGHLMGAQYKITQKPEEADAIRRLVTGAYAHYVERLGKLPGPMLDGYSRASRTSRYGWWEY